MTPPPRSASINPRSARRQASPSIASLSPLAFAYLEKRLVLNARKPVSPQKIITQQITFSRRVGQKASSSRCRSTAGDPSCDLHPCLTGALRATTFNSPLQPPREPLLMKVSLIQMNSISDKAANIAAAEALIERAVAEEGPDWVLLPEQFDWAGGSKADKLANAEKPARRPGLRDGSRAGDQASHFCPRGLDHGEDRRRGPHPQHFGRLQSRRRGNRPLPQDPPVRRQDAGRNRLQGERDGQRGRQGGHLRLRGSHRRLLDLLRLALSRPVPGAGGKGRGDDRAAGRLHDADRQGPLGGAAARPRHRDGDLRLRQRPDRVVRRSATSSGTLTAIRWSPTPGAM